MGGSYKEQVITDGEGTPYSTENPLPVTPVTPVSGSSGAPVDHSGSIDDANENQPVMTIEVGCPWWEIVNPSDTDMWMNIGMPAVVGEGYPLFANGGNYTTGAWVPSGAINVICASAGKKFTAKKAPA